MRKIIAVLLVVAVVLAGCEEPIEIEIESSLPEIENELPQPEEEEEPEDEVEDRFTDEEKFGARANITLQRGMWDFSELEEATNFFFNTIEYSDSEGTRTIRADCTVVFADGDIERHVFFFSDKGEYLEDLEYFYDEYTEMYYTNLFDYEFTPSENDLLSRRTVNDLAQKYIQSNDKSHLGME
jgi:hypothetical protein